MMTRCTVVDPHKAGGWVVAGYIKHRQLPQLEVSLEIFVEIDLLNAREHRNLVWF